MIYIFLIIFIFSCADAHDTLEDTGFIPVDDFTSEKIIEIDTSGSERDASSLGCIQEDDFHNDIFKNNFKIQNSDQRDNQVILPINRVPGKNLGYSQCPLQK